MTSSLTSTSALAVATELLEAAGYQRAELEQSTNRPSVRLRIFEDPYGVVAIAAWDSWSEMSVGWPAAQAWLVELITERIPRSEAKAWDGYLVLLLPGTIGPEAEREVDAIRANTARVRKLPGIGLGSPSDIERTLAPLLPLLSAGEGEDDANALDLLPQLIDRDTAPTVVVEALVAAYQNARPLMEAIHLTLHPSGPEDAPD